MKYAGILIAAIGSGILFYYAGGKAWLGVYLMIWGNNFYEREK